MQRQMIMKVVLRNYAVTGIPLNRSLYAWMACDSSSLLLQRMSGDEAECHVPLYLQMKTGVLALEVLSLSEQNSVAQDFRRRSVLWME
jgi:hypothetical protein